MKNKKSSIIFQMKDGFVNMLRVWMREFQIIFSDVGVMVIIFAVPLFYPLLYSIIYYPEVVIDLPIAVVDMSNSTDSRQFIRNMDATPELSVKARCISMEEAILLFKKREIRGIIQIPEEFSTNIALNRQVTVSAYADMELFLYYKALATGSSLMTLEAGRQIQVRNLMNEGLTQRQAEVTAEPVRIDGNPIANRSGGFASYGIPASLILIIQQTLVLAIGILAGTARERHLFGTLVPLDRKRLGTLRLVMGKSAAYFTIYALLCIYMLGMIPHWFGYGQSANLTELMALITPFILSSIFMGLTLSVIFRNRESAMLLYLFTSIPLLFLSGIIWPLSNFDTIWLIVREIFPSSNAMFGFIKMNSMGATIAETGKEILSLWIQTGVYFLTACLVYGFQVNHSMHVRAELASHSYREIRERIAKRLAGE
ncbi:MAG: ABC transporter permease [Lentimicrobiaceae bacterium]|nr:ABC transporter permease [Lentimicrobiaceae bacterium]